VAVTAQATAEAEQLAARLETTMQTAFAAAANDGPENTTDKMKVIAMVVRDSMRDCLQLCAWLSRAPIFRERRHVGGDMARRDKRAPVKTHVWGGDQPRSSNPHRRIDPVF
jgi:hypothetical protein